MDSKYLKMKRKNFMLKQEWKIFSSHLDKSCTGCNHFDSKFICVYLLGSMGSYGNTDKIPVAVVNHDQAVDYGNSTLNVGKELVDRLQENQSMNFQCR